MSIRPSIPTGEPSWRWPHWTAVAALLAVAFSAGWWIRSPEVSIGGDEATYIILSHSLENGQYRDEFLPGTPPHAKYPPGNPLWIAGVRLIAGAHLDALRAANLLLLVLTALLVGDGVRRLTLPWFGVAGVGLTALNAALLPLAGTGLSEAPYAFLVTLSLWAALLADQAGSRRWTALGSLAAVGSYLTRTAGLATIVGIGAWLLYRRRWRALAAHVIASAMVMGGWFAYARWAAASTISVNYGQDLKHLGGAGGGGLSGLPAQVLHHARAYLLDDLPRAFPTPMIPGTIIDNLLWLALLGGAVLAGLIVAARRWPALAASLALSAGLLLAWPWQVERLLAPLIPLIVAVLLVGGHLPVAGRDGTVVTVVTAAMLLVTSAMGITGLRTRLASDRFHTCSRQAPYSDPRCFNAEARGLVAAARFAHDSLAPGAIVATSKPATLYYFGGVRTVPLDPILEQARTSRALEFEAAGAGYILLSQVLSNELESPRTLLRHCGALKVRAAPAPTTLLLERRSPQSPDGDACAALEAYQARSPAP